MDELQRKEFMNLTSVDPCFFLHQELRLVTPGKVEFYFFFLILSLGRGANKYIFPAFQVQTSPLLVISTKS